MSRLHKISNPGYFGSGEKLDVLLIKQLKETFEQNFHLADHRLRNIKDNGDMAYMYATCVLFPETFIHQLRMAGQGSEEAEFAFLEVHFDDEERKALEVEIKEMSKILKH